MMISQEVSNQWHLLKGDQKLGPYTYDEMIHMMQDKFIYGFDFVWAPHLESWTLMGDLPEFSSDRIHRIYEDVQQRSSQFPTPDSESLFGPKVFYKRTSPRIPIRLPLYIHNDIRMWAGCIESISRKGALLKMDNPFVLPGESLTLHFIKHPQTERAFTCKVEVVGKKLSKKKLKHDSTLEYIVKFLELTEMGSQQIEQIMMKEQGRYL